MEVLRQYFAYILAILAVIGLLVSRWLSHPSKKRKRAKAILLLLKTGERTGWDIATLMTDTHRDDIRRALWSLEDDGLISRTCEDLDSKMTAVSKLLEDPLHYSYALTPEGRKQLQPDFFAT